MLTDQQLMQQVQQGRIEFFEELVRRHEPALLRAARNKLCNRQWAEEAVQETFLAAFASRQRFDQRYSLRGWLWTILLNECRTLSRRERHRADRGAGWSMEASAVPEPFTGATQLPDLLRAERDELLARLLAELPEAEADALRMRFFGELQFQEIAEAAACSLNGAKMRVKRGLERLAAAMSRQDCRLTGGDVP